MTTVDFDQLGLDAGRLMIEDDLFRALVDDFVLWFDENILVDEESAMRIKIWAKSGFQMGYAARDQELAQDYALPDGK